MSNWDVNLVFIDDKSKKFWRARKDGGDLYVNWGRIGTDGQTQLKELGSPDACQKEYDKLVASKRKKGYVDEGGAPEEAPTEVPAPSGPTMVDMVFAGGGRKMELRLTADGSVIRTEVVETYESPGEAQAALQRITEAMRAEGYRSA